MTDLENVVLAHGGLVERSGWPASTSYHLTRPVRGLFRSGDELPLRSLEGLGVRSRP
jgi:hypothetical protein